MSDLSRQLGMANPCWIWKNPNQHSRKTHSVKIYNAAPKSCVDDRAMWEHAMNGKVQWGDARDLTCQICTKASNKKPLLRMQLLLVIPGADDLIACRDLCAGVGLSLEPLVGPVDLREYIRRIDWLIVGGESGPHARQCNVAWIRDIVQQCADAGVRCYVKQLGAKCEITGESHRKWPHDCDHWGRYEEEFDRWWATFRDKKGGDINEWPEDLRIRQYPWED